VLLLKSLSVDMYGLTRHPFESRFGRKDGVDEATRTRYSAQAAYSQACRTDARHFQDLPIFRDRTGEVLSLESSLAAAGRSRPGKPQDCAEEPGGPDGSGDCREGPTSAAELSPGTHSDRLVSGALSQLEIYDRHTQANAITFIDYVIAKFPFRIREVRTDNGHEFQAKFHWHVEDQGIRHAYIKPSSPQLNGKVERSHRTDEQEFYQLLTYTDDIDLREKLAEWERFYNLSRPHGAFNGKAPYEILRERL